MQQFAWSGPEPVPPQWDLRRLGWCRSEHCGDTDVPLLIARSGPGEVADWPERLVAATAERRRALLLGIDGSSARARLLSSGFGDVLDGAAGLEELAARAVRLVEVLRALPPERTIGALRLDLLRRDAMVGNRALGLHPREFLLLWRLADSPGQAVSAAMLLREVWHLSFKPETNSLAVHVSRLRSKLRPFGLDRMIITDTAGAYRIDGEAVLPAIAFGPDRGLDAHLRLGKEAAPAA